MHDSIGVTKNYYMLCLWTVIYHFLVLYPNKDNHSKQTHIVCARMTLKILKFLPRNNQQLFV